jgi:hypothetical protein
MSCFRSRELRDRTLSETGHAAALPAEYRLKLCDGRTVLGCARRTDLPNAVRTLVDASATASSAKQIAERFAPR